MPAAPRVLAFSGSTRRDSLNDLAVRAAADGARAAGAEVTLIKLRDYPMPLFDEDLETASGLPAPALAFRELLLHHDALLIASPEYNSSLTAILKNAIDWASRPRQGEKPLACFAGKVAGLVAASPGALGGIRGLVHLRAILGNIQVLVLPDQACVTKAHEAFDPAGRLRDDKTRALVESVGSRVAHVAARLKA